MNFSSPLALISPEPGSPLAQIHKSVPERRSSISPRAQRHVLKLEPGIRKAGEDEDKAENAMTRIPSRNWRIKEKVMR